MSSFVVLVGQVDGEVKVNSVGDQNKKVANFRIATNPGWHSVSAWESLATQAAGLPVGATIIVQGRLSGRSYESDKYRDAEGKAAKISTVEIVASTIEVIVASTIEVIGAAVPTEDLFE